MSGLLASVRVLDLGGADSDGVGRLFADLGADVLKIEPPGGSATPGTAQRRRHQHRVRGAERQQAQRRARPGPRRRPRRLVELAGTADILVDSDRRGGRVRDIVHGTRRAIQPPGRVVGHRLRHDRTVRVVARHRPGAVRVVDRAVADRTDVGDTRLAAKRCRFGDGRRTGRVGCAGRATITGCVPAEAITSTSPASKRSLQSLDPPYGSEGQAAVGLKRSPPNCGGVDREIRTSIRSSAVRTATSGSACSRPANGVA